jgi:hypothetical protein
VNRNRLLVNGKPYLFTVPLKNASQNVLIKDLQVAISDQWITKFLRTITCAYKKAPFINAIYPMIEAVVRTPSKFLRDWHITSLDLIKNYLNIATTLVETSTIYANSHLRGQHRILDICLHEHAQQYINPIGGQQLYERLIFQEHGIILNFLHSQELVYQQYNQNFVPWLSIIDVMVFNSKSLLQRYLVQCELV